MITLLSPTRPAGPLRQARVARFWDSCLRDGRLITSLPDVFATPWRTQPVRVQTVNLQHVYQIATSQQAADSARAADRISADGWPLAVLGRRMGLACERVTGREIVGALLEDASFVGTRVALLGSSAAVGSTFGELLACNGVVLAHSCHGDARTWDVEAIAAEVTRLDCDVVLIALGAPRGEVLGQRLAELLTRGLIVGIGGAVEMATQDMPGAPDWVGRAGLEWAYRLVHEPRRLGRRYLIESPRALLALAMVLARA